MIKVFDILIFISITAISSSQTVIEYRYVGDELYGIDSTGNFIKLKNHNYHSKDLPPPITNYQIPVDYKPSEKVSISGTGNKYLVKSGNLLITASSLLIVGGVLTGIGAYKDIPELAYTGSAIGGVSIFFFIGSGVNLKRAGTFKP